MPPIVDKETCTLCGTCYDACPQDVFSWEEEARPEVVYPKECWHCGACVIDCPVDAIHLELPLHMQIVPSPALYGPEGEAERRAAAFTRSVTEWGGEDG